MLLRKFTCLTFSVRHAHQGDESRSVLVTAFSMLLVIIMSCMLVYTWFHYCELREDQTLRQMKYLNQRDSPVNE